MSHRKQTLAVALSAILVLSLFSVAAVTDASASNHKLIVDDSFNENNPDNDNDNKFETIQGAVNHAEPGDVIEVREGTYTENVVVDKAVTINGAGTGVTTLQANESGSPTLILGADDVEFRNMTVVAPQGDNGNGEEAVLVQDEIDESYVQDVLIEDNVFVGHDSTHTLARVTPATGNDLARRITFQNNEFTGGTLGSMKYALVLQAQQSTLTGNVFDTMIQEDGAVVKVDGPQNSLQDTTINYPGYARYGLWITEAGTDTSVNTLMVDGHPDNHQHQDPDRGDWLKWGVYVDGSGSTLQDVNVHETHIGIQIGGTQSQNAVSDVTLLDSMGDKNRNHDLKVAGEAKRVTVENFHAKSSVMPVENDWVFQGVHPTSGANVFVDDYEQDGPDNHELIDVTTLSDSPIGIRLEADNSLVENAHVENKGSSTAPELDTTYEIATTGISLDDAHNNTITNSLVANNDVGISLHESNHNDIVGNNPGIYNNTDAGIRLDESDGTMLADNDVQDNGIGLDVLDSEDTRAKYNNFVGNGDGIVADDSVVDARWNWFGATDGPSGSATDGDLSGSGDSIVATAGGEIMYDPFLTAPKDEVEQDPDKTVQFGHDLVTNGSQGIQSVGTPGPADVTFQFSPGADVEVYSYDAAADTFPQPGSANIQADTLDAWIITDLDHTEDARVVIDFSDATPSTPGAANLEPGWNFVTSPQAGATEDVIRTTTDVKRIAHGYDQFSSQPAPMGDSSAFSYPMGSDSSGPDLSAYTGYWIYVDGSGQITAVIPSGVTITEEGGLVTT